MGYVMSVARWSTRCSTDPARVPEGAGLLAVATLIVCTFWGIASGLVGAVVVLMGVIAFNPMLKAGYDVKLAAGVITAGGTLGILIPPSVMIIVYAAVAGQSIVKLYAAAMFPASSCHSRTVYRRLGERSIRRPRRDCRKNKRKRCRRG
jgi:TRAP-type mannitol/chloroaromatic compound transport system permease large subunit